MVTITRICTSDKVSKKKKKPKTQASVNTSGISNAYSPVCCIMPNDVLILIMGDGHSHCHLGGKLTQDLLVLFLQLLMRL